MLKRDITYEDFNGNTVTETFHFNLTKMELVELNISHKEGLDAFIKRIIEAEDIKSLYDEFKALVLMSYGVRGEDGKTFAKSEELKSAFSQTLAFDSLLWELTTDEEAGSIFIKGILPRGWEEEVARVAEKMKALEESNKIKEVPRPPSLPESS